jgi:hypothetical protein
MGLLCNLREASGHEDDSYPDDSKAQLEATTLGRFTSIVVRVRYT